MSSFFPHSFLMLFAHLCIFKTIQADCKECHSVVMCERLNKLLCSVMSWLRVYVCWWQVCVTIRRQACVCTYMKWFVAVACSCANMAPCHLSRRKKNLSGRSWKKSWRRITARSPMLKPSWLRSSCAL